MKLKKASSQDLAGLVQSRRPWYDVNTRRVPQSVRDPEACARASKEQAGKKCVADCCRPLDCMVFAAVAAVFQASNGLDEMQTAYTNGKDKAGCVLVASNVIGYCYEAVLDSRRHTTTSREFRSQGQPTIVSSHNDAAARVPGCGHRARSRRSGSRSPEATQITSRRLSGTAMQPLS